MDPDIPEPHGYGGGGGGGQPSTTPPKDSQQDSKDALISLVGVNKPPMDPSSPATNAASGRLVYVRRRVEADPSKGGGTGTGTTHIGTATNPPMEPTLPVPVVSPSPQGSSSHRLDWEERYHHLQMLLNKLNDSDQTDHVQILWSLSSAELSKHAVELEKRSIQFSLEEAREMQRVAALNVLGRSVNSLKSTSNDGE